MKEPSSIRILLIDDHQLFREGTARLLAAESDLLIAGGCGSLEEALAIVQSTPVDLVLLDLDLGKERGLQFFGPFRDIGFSGQILVVAAVIGLFEARRLIQAGAAGVFLKQNPPSLLLSAIHMVMNGALYIDPSLQETFHSGGGGSSLSAAEITSRHQAVWRGVVEGLTNKEIASRVHISEALVKVTLQQLFDQYGVRTRSHLVRIALGKKPSVVSTSVRRVLLRANDRWPNRPHSSSS